MPDLVIDPEERLRDADVLIDEFINRVTDDLERVKDEPFDPDYESGFGKRRDDSRSS